MCAGVYAQILGEIVCVIVFVLREEHQLLGRTSVIINYSVKRGKGLNDLNIFT